MAERHDERERRCPLCGGWMLWSAYQSRPKCWRCGYTEPERVQVARTSEGTDERREAVRHG